MLNAINHISINNFKSIRSWEEKDLKRINLFIGRPNAGKSNIIEALSLFSIPFLRKNTTKKLSGLLRLENEAELFHNGNTEESAIVHTNIGSCKLNYNSQEGLTITINHGNNHFNYNVASNLALKSNRKNKPYASPIKKYDYTQNITYKKSLLKYLLPPFGDNLPTIIEQYDILKSEISTLLKECSLELAFDKNEHSIKFAQTGKKDNSFLLSNQSVADTVRRILFYKAAIVSNSNSILLFENPEAHAFPTYLTNITQEIIYKKDNQYFLSTHSPFVLNDLLENSLDELAVFIVYNEQTETKVRRLTQEDLYNVLQSGVDLFTNNESFYTCSNQQKAHTSP